MSSSEEESCEQQPLCRNHGENGTIQSSLGFGPTL